MKTSTKISRRTAIVTGGSQGLGLALVTALANDGWNVVTDARNGDVLRRATAPLGSRVTPLGGDLTDSTHRTALVDAAVAFGRPVDLIINNVSTLGELPMPTLLDTSLSSFTATFETNVVAPLALIQQAADRFSPHPVIINISSDAGVEAYPGWGSYGVSKAALDHFSRVLAAEHPDWLVYSVDPGDMRTAMHQDAFPGQDISDRPEPNASVPGFLALLAGSHTSGRYIAREVA